MSAFVDVLLAPVPIAFAVLLLRHGPPALLVTVAGMVAILAGEDRGKRALRVLRLLRKPPTDGGQR